jgi:hypothetical protein
MPPPPCCAWSPPPFHGGGDNTNPFPQRGFAPELWQVRSREARRRSAKKTAGVVPAAHLRAPAREARYLKLGGGVRSPKPEPRWNADKRAAPEALFGRGLRLPCNIRCKTCSTVPGGRISQSIRMVLAPPTSWHWETHLLQPHSLEED